MMMPTPRALIVRRRVPKVTEQLGSVVEQWNEITAIAADLAALMPRTVSQAQQSFAFADGAPEPAIAGGAAGHELRRALERLLPPTVTAEDARRALDRIDLALLPLHRGEPRGSLERIRYLTISGNAGTPLAASFTWPSELAEPEPRFATVRPLPKGESPTGDLQFDHTRSDASSKLAGNQLHNFSSFLERSWRINDWMWGQMDAAATLVDLVLDPARLAQMSTTWRHDLADSIHRICTGPLRVGGSVHQWSRAIVEVAEGVWTDDVIEHVRDELAAVAPGSPVPPVTRTLLLWRRHTEIAAVEFDREQDNGPTGKPRPASLTEGMGQWDATSRAITDKWGEKRVTALGMRTVFVGWRALFAGVKLWPFGLVRSLLGPILAPLAMFTLCRRRTSFAFAVFLFGFVVPRVWSSGVGRVLVGVLAVAFASVWLCAHARHLGRRPGPTPAPLRLRHRVLGRGHDRRHAGRAGRARARQGELVAQRPSGDTAARWAVALRPPRGRGGDRHLRHLVLGQAAVAGGDHGAQRRHRRRVGVVRGQDRDRRTRAVAVAPARWDRSGGRSSS